MKVALYFAFRSRQMSERQNDWGSFFSGSIRPEAFLRPDDPIRDQMATSCDIKLSCDIIEKKACVAKYKNLLDEILICKVMQNENLS